MATATTRNNPTEPKDEQSFSAELPYPISVGPNPLYGASVPQGGGVENFDTPGAAELNRARLTHLASLNLPLRARTVLDVGCGVGHLAQFFVQQQCQVLSVDARSENISRLRELYPTLAAKVFDLELDPLSELGRFELVFAYGLLYHLENPFRALIRLGSICEDLLLLETMVLDHHLPLVRMADETLAYSQALRNVGCRPTPSFIAIALRSAGFRHIYAPKSPPDHPDYHFSWKDDLSDTRDGHLLRCVFIASRCPVENSTLISLFDR
jgi:SAM-dependent methyltransferase